jgi:hypothetical protein
MVYIPQAAFYAGDPDQFYAFRETSTVGSSAPWYISSESAITTTNGSTGNFYYPGPGDAAGSIFTIPVAFPKGYEASYMMKGEISQSQWITFFNMLTNTQKTERDITGNHATYGGKNTDAILERNNISWSSGEATLNSNTHSGVAMGYLAWADLIAYLDWAGLRPMSELEYEKAGRGPLPVVALEYAWGSTSITAATSITNDGLSSERAQIGANCAVDPGVSGPLRVGSFAKGVTGRVESGAGFYGAMELSGNIAEQVVAVSTSSGRSFEARYHGDGVITSAGDANVSTWPGTTALGTGNRGGRYSHSSDDARLSDRGRVSGTGSVSRFKANGGRGVRKAP